MPDAVVIDTNILPTWRGLDGPVWLSVRKLCELADIELVIPEIVVHESLNLRSVSFGQAATRFVDAFADIEKFLDIEPIYVPDESEIRDSWESEIRSVFTVLPIDGEDAIEALRREATRVRPARDGKGSRDSAVWLSVARLASEGRRVLFVSNNTKDFGVRKTNSLHPDLVEEASRLEGDVEFFTSIYALIDALATKVEKPEMSSEDLAPLLGFDFRKLALATTAEDDRFEEVSATDLIEENLQITDVETKSAYRIADRNLVLVMGRGFLPVGAAADDEGISFSFSAWIDFDPDDGSVLAGEVQKFSLDDPA